MNNNAFRSDECWESDLEQIKDCGKAPQSIIVWLKPIVKRKIDLLMEKYKSREWLAYLMGKDKEYIIEDMVFPKQNATTGSVNDIKFPDGVKIIGVIHSHHGMGAFFSGTDDEYINGNHDISIVVSHNGVKGTVRWNTPCGCKKEVDAKVKIYIKSNFDEAAFMKDVESKMVVEPIARVYTPSYYMADCDGYWGQDNQNDVDTPPVEGDTENNRPSLRKALEADIKH